jgi:autotransporter passenger strand-loop-strand repeat protein
VLVVTNSGLVHSTAYSAVVGVQDLYGSAIDTSVTSYSTQLVSSGGFASSTTIATSGQQVVDAGGTASVTTIQSSGFQAVNSGGSAVSTTIDGGGTQNLSAGATALTTTIDAGAVQSVYSGATAVSTVDRGVQEVSGTASATSVYGAQNVYNSAFSTTVENGGTQTLTGDLAPDQSHTIFASATSTTVAGVQIVETGSALVTVIDSSGRQTISAGARADSTTIDGGAQIVYGAANSTTIDGGYQRVYAGAAAVTTTIEGGGTQYATGIVSATTIDHHGTQVAYAGADVISTTVESGGLAWITVGATADGITVNSGGDLKINSFSDTPIAAVALSTGASIDIVASAFQAGELASATSTGQLEVYTVTTGVTTIDATYGDAGFLTGSYAGEYFQLASDGSGGTLVSLSDTPPCYVRGTRIPRASGRSASVPVRSRTRCRPGICGSAPDTRLRSVAC